MCERDWKDVSLLTGHDLLTIWSRLLTYEHGLSNPNVCAACGVRRAASAVRRPWFFCPEHIGNRMTYLDDIWYVGGSRSEVAHAEFWAWQMPIKYLIWIIYAKICRSISREPYAPPG